MATPNILSLKVQVKREVSAKRRNRNPYKTAAQLAARKLARRTMRAAAPPYDREVDIERIARFRAAVRASRKAMSLAKTPEQLEAVLADRREARKAGMREYAKRRRAARKVIPELAEMDRIRNREVMRVYLARRRAEDPAFAEACRTANRENARRRRAKERASASNVAEVDET